MSGQTFVVTSVPTITPNEPATHAAPNTERPVETTQRVKCTGASELPRELYRQRGGEESRRTLSRTCQPSDAQASLFFFSSFRSCTSKSCLCNYANAVYVGYIPLLLIQLLLWVGLTASSKPLGFCPHFVNCDHSLFPTRVVLVFSTLSHYTK